MEDRDSLQIDIRKVLYSKAPSIAPQIPNFMVNYLIRIIHQDEINDILSRYRGVEGVDFMRALIREFDLTLDIVGEENLPKGGRYIFVSNHPLGGMDGICLSAYLGERYDQKIRYLVNDLLLFIPNLKNIFVPINKHGIEETFQSDNQVITFPAGLCSRKNGKRIEDLDWKKSFIQKAISYQRDIVPIYFEGHNSNFFYRLANLRKKLGFKMNFEMVYLPDEMFRNKHQTFRIHFLKPISWHTFDQSRTPTAWAQWVKEQVYKQQRN